MWKCSKLKENKESWQLKTIHGKNKRETNGATQSYGSLWHLGLLYIFIKHIRTSELLSMQRWPSRTEKESYWNYELKIQ